MKTALHLVELVEVNSSGNIFAATANKQREQVIYTCIKIISFMVHLVSQSHANVTSCPVDYVKELFKYT